MHGGLSDFQSSWAPQYSPQPFGSPPERLSAYSASHALSLSLDLLGSLIINVHDFIVGSVGGFEKSVQHRVNSLRFSVFGPLDDQRHAPRGERGQLMSIQALLKVIQAIP